MSMTNTAPIAAASLLVLEQEMLLTSARALRDPGAVSLVAPLAAAQATYEAEILMRTTPVGSTPTSYPAWS